MSGPWLASGEMSRRSGLSPKALRLYHAKGLLVPARVDEATGYREYAPDQLARGAAIALLRRLDMPLARIAEVVDAPAGDAQALVLAWQREREETLAADRELLAAFADRSVASDAVGPVRRREVGERTVACVTSEVVQPSLVATFTGDVLALRAHLAAQGAEFGDEFWVIYHDTTRVPGRIETCVPYRGAVDPAGAVTLRAEPAGAELFVPLTAAQCRYPEILPAFAAVTAAATGSATGERAAGPPREIYPVPWNEDARAVVAEVAIPVDR